jgi:cellobiose phosphorylase
MIENKYGHLSEDHKEFIITDPRTPRPWFNYMWNEKYAGLISHTSGGFSFMESPRDNRINRMNYNSLPWDRPGRYVMIKDTDTGKYWSLSWAPTIQFEYDKYKCRHGLGYTKILTDAENILGEITYFVPNDMNAEIWKVKLHNKAKSKRNLEVYSFIMLLMGNALNDIINQPNDKHFTNIKFNKDKSTLEATRRYWVLNKKVSVAQPNIAWGYQIYFTQSLPITGFDGSLDSFIGKWRSEANPKSIETGKMKNNEITAGDPIAALQSKVELLPDESIEFDVVLALADKEEKDPYEFLNWTEFKKPDYASEKLNALKKKWDRYVDHVKVDTPDEKFNAMINVWNKYQTAVTFDMARNSGYYHGGLLFGTGMRDQFQDILGEVIVNPKRVRSRLLNALKYQFSDGSTLHNFFKLTGYGEKTNHSDTPLWIPFGIIEYLNETGDFSILKETASFYDEGEADLYEHLKLAVQFAISATTERGLPKIMNGDWNDTLDHVGPAGKGETVWGGFFLAYILKKTFELLEYQNDNETLELWKKEYEKLKKTINKNCWDGNWYLRAFRDNGKAIGSAKDKQGKIFLNAQTWSVISGIADKERADSSLSSCKKYLTTPYGMQIVSPSYTEVEDDVGLISRCVPGKKENGAVFNHASSWFVLASILNGDAEGAYEVYTKMNPLNSSTNIDRYETEPYVYSEYVTSPDHETENQASHSWLTGSAVWMYRIGLDYILGFKTSLKGIKIEPNIPSEWQGFKAERTFRGKDIKLIVSRESENKPKDIKINGKVQSNNFLDVSSFTEKEILIETVI